MIIDKNAAITLLETMIVLKKIQAMDGIRTYDLCVNGAKLYQLRYQSHARAVVCEFGPLCFFYAAFASIKLVL